MSDAKTMRLSKVAKEFNLSLGKITEFLAAKGRPVENNPNAKIGDEEYALLSKEFSGDKSAKEEAQHVGLSLNKLKRESIVIEDTKALKAKELEEQKEREILAAAAAKAAEEKKKLKKQLKLKQLKKRKLPLKLRCKKPFLKQVQKLLMLFQALRY